MKVCRLCRRYVSGGVEECTFDGGELLEGPVPPFAPGDSLGEYEVKRVLAAGQSGVLFVCTKGETEAAEGEDEGEAEEVIVKVLNKAAGTTDARSAVLDTVTTLVDLEGLHVFTEMFEHDDRLCVVQPKLTGTTLAALLKTNGPLDQSETLALGQRLCEVLLVVHESGLNHGDVRPGHLMVPEGLTARDAQLFDLGSPSPPGYLAPPELYDGCPDAEKSDVYGLCVTLYVALAGRSPFKAEAPEELDWLIHNAPPPPLRVVRKTGPVDPGLERLVMQGMVKDPRERPTLEQAGELLEAIASDDHDEVDRVLTQVSHDAQAVVAEGAKQAAEPDEEKAAPSAPAKSARSFLDDDNPTMQFVRRVLPESVLKSTGLTAAFFMDGDVLEREMNQEAARARREEARGRRENLAAWLRLITLLLIALALGGITVWALLH